MNNAFPTILAAVALEACVPSTTPEPPVIHPQIIPTPPPGPDIKALSAIEKTLTARIDYHKSLDRYLNGEDKLEVSVCMGNMEVKDCVTNTRIRAKNLELKKGEVTDCKKEATPSPRCEQLIEDNKGAPGIDNVYACREAVRKCLINVRAKQDDDAQLLTK